MLGPTQLIPDGMFTWERVAVCKQARLRGAYSEMLLILRTLYQDCRLVHGDLSEYNILVHEVTTLRFCVYSGTMLPSCAAKCHVGLQGQVSLCHMHNPARTSHRSQGQGTACTRVSCTTVFYRRCPRAVCRMKRRASYTSST